MGFALVFLGGDFFLSAVLFSCFFHNVMFGCLRVEFFFYPFTGCLIIIRRHFCSCMGIYISVLFYLWYSIHVLKFRRTSGGVWFCQLFCLMTV
mgnify:CR=1 FL=1